MIDSVHPYVDIQTVDLLLLKRSRSPIGKAERPRLYFLALISVLTGTITSCGFKTCSIRRATSIRINMIPIET